MPRTRSLAPVCLLVALACKREPEPAATAAAPRDRKARCEAIADDVTRMGMLVAKGLAHGLSDGKAKLEGDAEAELRRELETAKLELVEQCMTWPEAALDCFGASAVFKGDECERIVAAAMGEPVLPAGVPAGPPPAWRFELPHALALLHGRPDGAVIAVVEPESPAEGEPAAYAIAVRAGAELWRSPTSFAPFVVEALGDDTVLMVGDDAIVALGIADGAVRWTAKPPPPPPRADEYVGPTELVALARDGEMVVLLTSDHRLLRLRPERCAAGECVEPLASLQVPESYGTQWLVRGVADTWVVVQPDDARAVVVDASGAPQLTILGHTTVSWAEAAGDVLRVGLDGAVVALDVPRCGAATVAPVPWPPAGKPKWLADANVRTLEVGPTPPGCVRWQAPVRMHAGSDVVATTDGSVLVQAGGFLLGFDAAGTPRFDTPVATQSFVVRTGDAYAVVGNLGTDEVDLVLSWIGRDGAHLRRSSLPLGKGELFVDDVELQAAGDTLVAGLGRTLVAFAR